MTIRLAASFTETSPGSASTAVSSQTVYGLDVYDTIAIYASLTGATGGTLDVYLQSSFDSGTTWYDYAHWPQIAATTAVKTYPIIVQTSGVTDATTVIGKGTLASPGQAVAAGTVVGGPWGPAMRIVYVAGTGTTLGASQAFDFVGYQRQR